MNEIFKKFLQIIISVIVLVIIVVINNIFSLPLYVTFILFLIPYLIAGYDVYIGSVEEFREGEIFNENLLMCIATIGAFLICFLPDSSPEFLEAVFVMILFQVGELFEIIASNNSEKSISSLLQIRGDYANLVVDDEVVRCDSINVKVGDTIIINPYEKVPLDGVVIDGVSSLNTVALTGESIPKKVKFGDNILSGCVNNEGQIKVKTTKLFGDSTASKIIDLVKNANDHKSSSDKFITKFAKIYTPIVVLMAIVIATVPSFITGDYVTWIKRSLNFLVVSCPCALVISVPLSYFGGVGGSAKKGVLIKGANYLEALSKVSTIVFDKTGTLTEGVFKVTAIHPSLYDENELLHLAYHVESVSSHPIAVSLRQAYFERVKKGDHCHIEEVEENSGYGVKAKVNGEFIYVGNDKLMKKIKIKYDKCDEVGSIIHIATKDKYLGHIIISDKIKDDSFEALELINKLNINTVMLTGDSEKIASNISKKLGIDSYYAELLPEDKVKIVEDIIEKNESGLVSFVGDGINDAPVIARSDIGISMGAMGADAAIEAADVVLMNDKITNLFSAIKISKKTQRIALENIYFAIIVKVLVLILSATGFASMWLAVFADVGVTVLAVINSMRTLK